MELPNAMVPFLWMHGEDDDVLRDTVRAIHASGIGALCVEARPHPDFLGPKWWHDMDIVLEECKARGMQMWILDDAHFPTGYAAGRAAQSPHRVRYLYEFHVDIMGPQTGTSLLIRVPQEKPGDRVIAVVAAKRVPGRDTDQNTFVNIEPSAVEDPVDLTGLLEGDLVYWDIPDGLWRVFIIYERYGTGDDYRDRYINLLCAEGTDILLNSVYEEHYRHYAADFGKTIRGFFSDEPQFGGMATYGGIIGRTPRMMLPWSDDVLPMLSEALGRDARMLLPGLWSDIGTPTAALRVAYMDSVTKLYSRNFCSRIGDWCRAHGVEYMGHVIEENNTHARLGCGTGHYFRALWGQDLAGIDIVLSDLIPGIKGTSHAHHAAEFEADNDFFYYCLAQLAASLAHIDPKKHGRAMCEIFGAYGWQEGLKEMKWLADFMMSRGINVFVPHAFTPKAFPDPDCPPHFYAHGNNPQYPYFKLLMDYMNRVCSLITGGRSLANAAVLYYAEAEWASAGAMKTQELVKRLTQSQIECDIVPADLLSAANVHEGALCLNGYEYRALVVPYAPVLPASVLRALKSVSEAGLRVICTDALPAALPGEPETPLRCEALPLDSIVPALLADGLRGFAPQDFLPDLKIYPYRKGGTVNLLLFNESITAPVDTVLRMPIFPHVYRLDPFTNHLYTCEAAADGDGLSVPVHIEPGDMTVLVCSDAASDAIPAPVWQNGPVLSLEPYRVSIRESGKDTVFTPCPLITGEGSCSAKDKLPRFSGTIRYESAFTAPRSGRFLLDLGAVGETAEVLVNGVSAGVRIAPPYRFDLTDLVRDGRNTLTVDVTNTLVYRMHDQLSVYHAIAPSGLIGPVRLMNV